MTTTSLFTKITAGAAVLAVGGIGGAVLASPREPAQATVQSAAPVEVRTQVIRRTVRVVHHDKPKRRPAPAAAPPAAAAPAPPPAPVVVAQAAPVRVAAPAARSVHRLVSRTSSAGGRHGGEGEREHEGGDDD